MVSPVTVLLPTAYFPPVSYFANLISSTSGFIEQMETFPKQTYRNRCEILTASGKLNLVVPVTKPNGNHTLTKDIEICYREPWQQHHWKSIQTAYRSSPYFIFYADIIQPHFESRETLLITHNYNILKTISGLTGIIPSIEFTKEYLKAQPDLLDLRKKFSPGKALQLCEFPHYSQVFEYIHGFIPGLSVLDLLFNLGPDTRSYLEDLR